MRNETLTNVFWGLFLVWFGVMAAVLKGNFEMAANDHIFALGTGVLLLVMNLARSMLRLKLGVLTIGLGVLLVLIYTPLVFFDQQLPFLPALLVIAGVALIVGALRTRNYL